MRNISRCVPDHWNPQKIPDADASFSGFSVYFSRLRFRPFEDSGMTDAIAVSEFVVLFVRN
jgi:hypothetical protein